MKTTNTIIVAVLMVCLTRNSDAQNFYEIRSGNPFTPENGEISKLFDKDKDHLYFLQLTNKSYFELNCGDPVYIDVFSKQLIHEKSVKIQLPDGAKYRRLIPVSFYKVDDGFIILNKKYSTTGASTEAVIIKVDPDGFITNEIISPGKINDVPSSLKDFHFFDMFKILNEEGEVNFVFSVMTPPEMELAERINFIIYNRMLEVVDQRLISFPEDHLDYKFSELEYGSTGHIFFRIEIRNPYLMDKTIHQLIIYDLFSDSNQSYEFKLEEGIIDKIKLSVANKEVIGLIGTYKTTKEDEIPTGVFYYTFDAGSGELLRQNIMELSETSLDVLNPKNHESNEDFKNLIPQKLCVGSEGELFFIMEYFRRSMLLVQDADGKMYNKPVFYANEIFILDFDIDDKLLGTGCIPKQQFSRHNSNPISFDAFQQSGKIVLIYNDHPINSTVYNDEKLRVMKGKFKPMMVIYNPVERNYVKKELESDEKINFAKDQVYRIGDDTLLLVNSGNTLLLTEIIFGL